MLNISGVLNISSDEFVTEINFLFPDELRIIHLEDDYYFSDRKPVRFVVEASDGTDCSHKFHYTDLGDKYRLKSDELDENLKYKIFAVYNITDFLPILFDEKIYITDDITDDITKKKRKYKKRKFYQPKQRFFD